MKPRSRSLARVANSLTILPLLIGLIATVAAAGPAASNNEARTAQYFLAVRKDATRLLPFLREMPKGGDLHNHLTGSIYAESWIDFAVDDGLCVDRTTSVLIAPPC